MNVTPATRRARSALAAILALVPLCLVGYQLFGRLGDMYIVDYDEARHGVNAFEMIRSGDYVVSTYQGQPDLWNLKPPLSSWLIALGYRLFGEGALGLRFFSALAALLAACALAWWAYTREGPLAGLLVLLAVAANATLVGLHFARYGDADSQYQLFFTLSMLCLLCGGQDVRWLYAGAACFGLAFLEKGLHAFNIPAIYLLALLCTGGLRKLRIGQFLLLLLCGAAPVLPWAALRYLRDGLTFFRAMVSTDMVGRIGATADAAGVGVPALLYYLRVLWSHPAVMVCLALSFTAAAVLAATRTRLTPGAARAALICLLWLLVPIALYSLMGAKFRWYIYSDLYAAPALACVLLPPALRVRGWSRPLAAAVGVAAVCFGILAACNAVAVSAPIDNTSVHAFIQAQLDFDIDEGRHAYIQYGENRQTVWMQSDMLTAYFAGNAICMDGGVEAYLADEESAVLFLVKSALNMDDLNRLYEIEPLRDENTYLAAFEK